jgi:hypothetical protein
MANEIQTTDLDRLLAKRRPPEENVTLTDGSVVRVTGLLAFKFRTDPDGVRRFVEDERAKWYRLKVPHAN